MQNFAITSAKEDNDNLCMYLSYLRLSTQPMLSNRHIYYIKGELDHNYSSTSGAYNAAIEHAQREEAKSGAMNRQPKLSLRIKKKSEGCKTMIQCNQYSAYNISQSRLLPQGGGANKPLISSAFSRGTSSIKRRSFNHLRDLRFVT